MTRPFIAALAVLALAGCVTVDVSGAAGTAAGTTAGTAAGTPTAAVAGQARGKVVTAAGQPLPGATVELFGTAATALPVALKATTGADGAWSMTNVPDGNYQVQAWTEATYNGKVYHLPAMPASGSHKDRLPATGGLARDFVWKIAGRKPGMPDASDPASYYGAQFEVYGSDAYGGQVAARSGGTLEVTLTPDGPLLDGSAGQPVKASLPFVNTGVPLELINDVPLGRYTLSASLVQGGTTTPMKVSTIGNGAEDYFPSVRVEPRDNEGVNLPSTAYQGNAIMKTKVYLTN